MNRTFAALAAGALVAAAASTASADFVLDLGDNSLGGGAFNEYTFELQGTLTDFAIAFDFVDVPSSASWASDMILQIIDPNGVSRHWGGFNVTPPGSTFVAFWSFDGSGSTSSGFYSDDSNPTGGVLSGSGTWTFRVWNGWSTSGVKEYNNFEVKTTGLGLIPAPGALALLGVAGLLGGRRRRA